MKNLFNKLTALVILGTLTFSCSKVQYASFGGGPKKLTALPSKNYYANIGEDQISASTTQKQGQQYSASLSNFSIAQEKEAISKTTASVKKLGFVQKLAVAHQVKQIQKQLAKAEKVSAPKEAADGGKSQIVALILALLVGGLGIHRFYLGYTTEGILQLLTAGGCGIWALIDLIRIVMGDLKPKGGDYDQKL